MIHGATRLMRSWLFACLALALVLPAASGDTTRAASQSTALAQQPANAVPADGSLIRDLSTGRIYFIWGGVRHWSETAAVRISLGFGSNDAVNLPSSTVDAIPAGTDMGQTLVDGLVFPLTPIDNHGGSLRMSVPSNTPGTVVAVTGSHFGHNEAVQIVFAGVTQTIASDGSGNFSASIAVPSAAQPNSVLRVVALGEISHVFAVEPFNVIATPDHATIVAQTASAAQNTRALVDGSGFAPNEQVSLFLGQTASASQTVTDQNGAFSGGSLAVPTSLGTGAHSLIAYGLSSKRFAQGTVNIVPPVPAAPASLTADRTSVNPGSLVQLRGGNFAPGETVRITLGSTLLLSLKCGSTGQFGPVGVTIPTTTTAGSYTLTAMGTVSNASATVTMTIVAFNPSLTALPVYAEPGTTVALSGQGYAPDELVTVALNGEAVATSPSQIKTDSAGSFSASFKVPATALAGTNTVAATGVISRASATKAIGVSLPVQSTWYFAGGNTAAGDDTQIALVNPNSAPAGVTFSFMFTSGSPMPYQTVVAAGSRTTVDVGTIVGPGRAVFTMLTADRKIGASETVFRNGQDFSSTIGASARSAPGTSRRATRASASTSTFVFSIRAPARLRPMYACCRSMAAPLPRCRRRSRHRPGWSSRECRRVRRIALGDRHQRSADSRGSADDLWTRRLRRHGTCGRSLAV